MKITNIESFIVDAGWRPWIFVKIETDEGITGYGECSDGGVDEHDGYDRVPGQCDVDEWSDDGGAGLQRVDDGWYEQYCGCDDVQ